jgi:hypothetical protein
MVAIGNSWREALMHFRYRFGGQDALHWTGMLLQPAEWGNLHKLGKKKVGERKRNKRRRK